MQIFIFSLFDVAILPQLDLIFISPLFCQYLAKKPDPTTKKLGRKGICLNVFQENTKTAKTEARDDVRVCIRDI